MYVYLMGASKDGRKRILETKTNHFSPSTFVGKPDRKILATFKEVKKSVRRKIL